MGLTCPSVYLFAAWSKSNASPRFTGSINYVPISKTSPANRYWGIDQTITYGNGTQIMKTSAGIVDTGTTLLLLASDAFQTYQKATGATLDRYVTLINVPRRLYSNNNHNSTTGLLTVTEAQYENMQSMHFRIGSVRCVSYILSDFAHSLFVEHLRAYCQRSNLASGYEHYHWWTGWQYLSYHCRSWRYRRFWSRFYQCAVSLCDVLCLQIF